MTLPVATDEYMVRLYWQTSSGPRTASHALHFRDNLGTQDATLLGATLLTNLTGNMWKLLAPSASINAILITPLDGVSTTFSQPFTAGNANVSGQGTGDAIPQGAAVVSIPSAIRGKSHRNRSYLPFVGEAEQSAGTLTPADVTTAQTAWTTFYGAMVTDDWHPSVISPSIAGPTNNHRDATGYTVRPYLKTQRRRARR